MESCDIFPKEIWEMILDLVEDSKDIQNVLKVFPSLDISFQERKRFWLIGQAISQLLICKLLQERDVLNCRLVCKQWSRRVDKYMENQPCLDAYHHDLHSDQVKDFFEPIQYECRLWVGGVEFQPTYQGSPLRFLKEMESCPTNRNPFLSRALSIIITDQGLTEELQKVYWNAIFQILERFGSHVWYLSLRVSWNQNHYDINPPQGFWQTFTKLINCLPCLKYLKLNGDGLYIEQALDLKGVSLLKMKKLPNLSNLETLKISANTFPPCFIHYLLLYFGDNLRRLEMPLDYWKPEYADFFPNLTELDVNDETFDPSTSSKTLQDIPTTLNCPKLVKLQLGFSISTCIFDTKEDLFRWLKRFPSLKYLNIGDDCRKVHPYMDGYFLRENWDLQPPLDSFHSLQFLVVRDSFYLSYNFLRCLPSLRHLIILIRPQPMVTDLSMPSETYIKLREQLQTLKLYESNIWEHLPKLNRVTLLQINKHDGELEEQYIYERATYELLKKAGKTEVTEFSSLKAECLNILGYFSYTSSDEESYLSDLNSEDEERNGEDDGRESDGHMTDDMMQWENDNNDL